MRSFFLSPLPIVERFPSFKRYRFTLGNHHMEHRAKKCCVCDTHQDAPSVDVRKGRLPFIRVWKPNGITERSRAHVGCLERIGLCQTPSLEMVAGIQQVLTDTILGIVNAVPRTRDVLGMCDRAWEDVVCAHSVNGELQDTTILPFEQTVRFYVTSQFVPTALGDTGPALPSSTTDIENTTNPSEEEKETVVVVDNKLSGGSGIVAGLPSIQWLEAYTRGLERAIQLERAATRRIIADTKTDKPLRRRRCVLPGKRRRLEDAVDLVSVLRAFGPYVSALPSHFGG